MFFTQPRHGFVYLKQSTQTVKAWAKDLADGAVLGLHVGDYRFIAENPNKQYENGKFAQAGHQISWAIHRPTNIWVLKNVNGVVEFLLKEDCIPSGKLQSNSRYH